MPNIDELIQLLAEARTLIQRMGHPDHLPTLDERLDFLADSETCLAETWGVKPKYWTPES